MADKDELNKVAYVGWDFDSLLDEQRARTQARFASVFNELVLSSLGNVLFDHHAFGLDALAFMLDRRATDLYTSTARTRQSTVLITRQQGYKMRPAVASSVDLTVTLSQTYAFSITIPQRFQFSGPDGLIFEASESVTLSPGETSKTVPVYEGETVVESFVSDGAVNQRFELRRVPEDKYIVAGVGVLVDGAQWIESEQLTFDETDQFEIGYLNEPPQLTFGNGVAGNIPPEASSIETTYVASRGKAGQVSQGTIDGVVTELVASFTVISLTVTNAEKSRGGDDPETLDSAKASASQVWKTRNVAVTQEDYESWSEAYADPLAGRVAVAKAISSRSAATDLALQVLLTDINDKATEPVPAVDAALAAITAALDTIDGALVQLQSDFTDIAGKTTGVDTELGASIDSARVAKNKSDEVSVDATDIQALVVAGKAAIDAIASGADQLTDPTKAALKVFYDNINSEAGNILIGASDIATAITSQISTMGQSRDKVEDIGLTLTDPDSLLLSAETQRVLIETEAGVVGPPATGIREDVEDIDEAVNDVAVDIEALTDDVFEHVDGLLAADCKANLITVPILTRDAGGFYTAPTVSLMRSLKSDLESRKEATQTIEVVSGEDFLIPAVISVRIGVLPNYSESIAKTTVTAIVEGVLRDRAFGDSLYLDEVYNPLKGQAGVKFLNVTIEGYDDGTGTNATKNDSDGNLIILDTDVVTKGSLSVTTEVASS